MPATSDHFARTLLVLTTALCACSARLAETERSVVLVENHNWNTATIYDERGARLGEVRRGETRRFAVRPGVGGRVLLQARLLASREHIETGPVVLRAGERLHWTITAAPAQSHYTMHKDRIDR